MQTTILSGEMQMSKRRSAGCTSNESNGGERNESMKDTKIVGMTTVSPFKVIFERVVANY